MEKTLEVERRESTSGEARRIRASTTRTILRRVAPSTGTFSLFWFVNFQLLAIVELRWETMLLSLFSSRRICEERRAKRAEDEVRGEEGRGELV